MVRGRRRDWTSGALLALASAGPLACTLDSSGTGELIARETGGAGGGTPGPGGGSGAPTGGAGTGAVAGGGAGAGGAAGAGAGGTAASSTGGNAGNTTSGGASPGGSGNLPECGNGVSEAPEECDDGNLTAGDGCAANCQVECPPGSTLGPNQHCYWFEQTARTWPEAKAACESRGGHLVTFANSDENAFISRVLQAEAWIGASDGRSPTTPGVGTYAWVNGEPWTFNAWAQGEPSASSQFCNFIQRCYEHCASMYTSGAWNDRYCEESELAAVCESEPLG